MHLSGKIKGLGMSVSGIFLPERDTKASAQMNSGASKPFLECFSAPVRLFYFPGTVISPSRPFEGCSTCFKEEWAGEDALLFPAGSAFLGQGRFFFFFLAIFLGCFFSVGASKLCPWMMAAAVSKGNRCPSSQMGWSLRCVHTYERFFGKKVIG